MSEEFPLNPNQVQPPQEGQAERPPQEGEAGHIGVAYQEGQQTAENEQPTTESSGDSQTEHSEPAHLGTIDHSDKGTSKKHRKLKRIFISVAIILTVVVVVPGFALAYAGFLPVGTELLHVNKPVDLGVRYTPADLNKLLGTLHAGIGCNLNGVVCGSGNDSAAAPQLLVDNTGPWTGGTVSFSSAELTALLNLPWTQSPIKNAQIKIDNNAFEFSGNMSATYVADLIRTINPSGNNDNLGFILRLASHLQNPAIYAKIGLTFTPNSNYQSLASSFGTGSDPYGYDNDGTVHFRLEDIKVNQIDLSDYLKSHTSTFDVNVGQGVKVGGDTYSLWWLALQDDQLQFDGAFPAGFFLTNDAASQWCKDFNLSYLNLAALNTVDGRIVAKTADCK